MGVGAEDQVDVRAVPALRGGEGAGEGELEVVGDVPNVVFPCAALADAPSGRIAIYYGCADTCTGIAYCQVDELLDFIKSNSRV